MRLALIGLLLVFGTSPTPQPTPSLQDTVLGAIANHQGAIGVVVSRLSSGETVAINADHRFTSASLYKLFVLDAAEAAIEAGSLDPTETLTVTSAVVAADPYSDLLAGTRLSVDCALRTMVEMSGNSAGDLLLRRLGVSAVNAQIRGLGLSNSAITADGAFTSAGDVATLLQSVARGEAVSSGASQRMLDLLAGQQHNDRLPAPLPLSVRVAHKTGELPGLRHDAGIIFAPSGAYVLSVLVEDAPSQSEARSAIVDVSRAVYAAFEPDGAPAYLGLPPRLAQQVVRTPDAQGRLALLGDPRTETTALPPDIAMSADAADSPVLPLADAGLHPSADVADDHARLSADAPVQPGADAADDHVRLSADALVQPGADAADDHARLSADALVQPGADAADDRLRLSADALVQPGADGDAPMRPGSNADAQMQLSARADSRTQRQSSSAAGPASHMSADVDARLRLSADADAAIRLRPELIGDLRALQQAAQQVGTPFWVRSGFQQPTDAEAAHAVPTEWILPCALEQPERVADRAASAADVAAAKPRQAWLGSVLSITDQQSGRPSSADDAASPAWQWLQQHAADYGFVPALPESTAPDAQAEAALAPSAVPHVGSPVPDLGPNAPAAPSSATAAPSDTSAAPSVASAAPSSAPAESDLGSNAPAAPSSPPAAPSVASAVLSSGPAAARALGHEPWTLRWVGRAMAARLLPVDADDYAQRATAELQRAEAELSLQDPRAVQPPAWGLHDSCWTVATTSTQGCPSRWYFLGLPLS